MSELNHEIGARVREVRELLEESETVFSERLGLSEEQLKGYEAGDLEFSVALLQKISQLCGISMTELMTGEAARLRQYAVVRRGKGVSVERQEAYGYRSLAYNFAGRRMEPLLITIPPASENTKPTRNTHSGQEFHYCLEGAFLVRIGTHEVSLEAGDSIYFDAATAHGMWALHGQPAKSLVVITN